MTRARTCATVVLVAAVMALSGCERGGGGLGPEPSAGASSAGPITGTITVWAQDAEADDLPVLLRQFETANPGVTVTVTAVPADAAYDKYRTAITGGTTPDVAQVSTTWFADLSHVGGGALTPVPKGVDTAGMIEGSNASAAVKGTSYGVPWSVDTRVIYYRTDLAARAGYPAPPATWTELKAMAKALQTKAGAKWGISLASGGAGAFQSALPFVWSGGAALMNPAGTRWTFDTPQMAGALQYYQSFFTDGAADRSAPTTAGAREAAFVDGSTPMLIDGSAEADRLYRAGGDGFSAKYAVMRIPRQQSSTSLLGGTDLVVFKQSKNRDAAWKLIQFLSQARVQLTWFKLTGNLPALRAAWQDPSLSDDAKLAVFKDQLTDVKAPPVSTAWTRVSAAADTELEHVVKSGTDPATAANALQHTADTIGTGG